MPKIKIYLDKGETEAEAQELLLKALSSTIDPKESFEDPAMVHMSEHLFKVGKDIYSDMMTEIVEVLHQEYE